MAAVTTMALVVLLAAVGDTFVVSDPSIVPDARFAIAIAETAPSDQPPFGWQTCSAVLVRPDLALTAAHCVDDRSGSLVVLVGLDDLCVPPGPSVARRSVIGIAVHPDHKVGTKEWDLAALVLESTIPMAPLPLVDSGRNLEGVDVTAWTWTSAGRTIQGCWLRPARLAVTADTACTGSAGTPFVFDPRSMICAIPTTPGGGTCAGDSGGPLLIDAGDSQATLVGLVSAGFGCGGTSPEIFARVDTSTLGFLNSYLK